MSGILQALMGAFPAAGGIQYVGGTTGFISSTAISVSLTGLTGGIASSPSENDLIIIYGGCSSTGAQGWTVQNNSSPSFPYTQIKSLYVNGTNDANLIVYQRLVGASAETTLSISHTGANADGLAVYVSVWRGVHIVTPLDVTDTSATSASTLIANPATITPVTSGSIIIAGAIGAGGSASVPANGVYTSSDLTAFRSVGGQGGARSVVVGGGYKVWTSGAFDPAAFSTTNITDSTSCTYASSTIALRPA